MNRVAIAFLTKDRTELSSRTIEPLLQPDKFDTWWFDGSATKEGTILPSNYQIKKTHFNVRGGPDAAVVFALSTLLDHRDESGNTYSFIGLCENDVLLDPGWFEPTFDLFGWGVVDGLNVGAVSARAYEDRILIQRDRYAIMHNLGWGMQIMTREAAQLALRHIRTSWTTENRRVFAQASGLDIGKWWAFRASENMLCADWGNDRVLAAHGLASLALTPSPVQMIGQTPSLVEQGLTLVAESVGELRNDKAFVTFVERMHRVHSEWNLAFAADRHLQQTDGSTIYFAHQCKDLGAIYNGAWRLKWVQGFGPFGWQAVGVGTEIVDSPSATIPVLGPCSFLVMGGSKGGEIKVEDLESGYECPVALRSDDGHITSIAVPAGSGSYRNVRLTAMMPGPTFFGIRTAYQQPVDLKKASRFRHSDLPPVVA